MVFRSRRVAVNADGRRCLCARSQLHTDARRERLRCSGTQRTRHTTQPCTVESVYIDSPPQTGRPACVSHFLLSRWVGSRHLPPRGKALWRRLGRRVAGRRGGHVTVLESRTTERQTRHTSMHARPATVSHCILTSYHVPITVSKYSSGVRGVGAGRVTNKRHREHKRSPSSEQSGAHACCIAPSHQDPSGPISTKYH